VAIVVATNPSVVTSQLGWRLPEQEISMKKIVVVFALVMSVVGCKQAQMVADKAGVDQQSVTDAAKQAAEEAPKDIVQTAAFKGFKQLSAALAKAELDKVLAGAGPFTVLAPTDEAFAKIPQEDLAMLFTDAGKDKLVKILQAHVIKGTALAADVKTLKEVETLGGTKFPVVVTSTGITIGNANVTMADVTATNGVIHAIDAVLMP
jgi:uncharacterized surface protein with fasciclin (FAS1) repeats